MQAIEIEGPDGTIYEFPEGTDDATIQEAMAQAYPAPSPQATEAGAPAGDGQIEHRNTWQGVNEAQAKMWATGMEDGSINPNAPVGSDQNPYVIPENVTQESINELVAKGVTFVDREGRRQRASHELLGLYTGAARPAINTLNWVENGVRAIGGEGAGDAFHDWRLDNARYTTQEGFDELQSAGKDAGFRPGQMGQVAGAVGAVAPLALATRNPWLLGATEGALGSAAQDARGLAVDTALGAVVGKGGDVAARALGTAINPNIQDATRRLLDQGVELSPGQVVGGAAHRLEDAATSVIGLGEIPLAAQRRAQDSISNVAVQRPLSHIGVTLPNNLRSTHEAVDFAQRAIGDAYDELIPQLDVRLDRQFAQEFNSLRQGVQNMNSRQGHPEQFEQLIQNEVMPRFNAALGPANGRITGESFKELESILGQEVRDFSSGNATPHDRRYASAVRELQAQLRDMLARGNPQHAERLQSINDAYRQMTVVEDAANSATAGSRGQFSAHQLEAAARRADPTVRRRAAARGDALFQDLSEDMGEVMKRTVPDSGTASRGMVGAAVGAGFLGQSLNIAINPWAVGALALGAMPYTRTGNRLFTSAIARRPDWAGAVRGVVDQAAPYAGVLAAANGSVSRNEHGDEQAESNAIAMDRDRVDAAILSAQQAEGVF